MGHDQRREPRVQVNHEFASLDSFLQEYLMNVSRGGAFIRSEDVLDEETLVDLRFTVIVDDFETIEGQGRVVRAQHEEPKGFGVVFTSLTDESREVLARLFTQQIVRDLSDGS
ncbi:MAG: PilZ domain-containing protein [Myxococcota bacterium]